MLEIGSTTVRVRLVCVTIISIDRTGRSALRRMWLFTRNTNLFSVVERYACCCQFLIHFAHCTVNPLHAGLYKLLLFGRSLKVPCVQYSLMIVFTRRIHLITMWGFLVAFVLAFNLITSMIAGLRHSLHRAVTARMNEWMMTDDWQSISDIVYFDARQTVLSSKYASTALILTITYFHSAVRVNAVQWCKCREWLATCQLKERFLIVREFWKSSCMCN